MGQSGEVGDERRQEGETRAWGLWVCPERSVTRGAKKVRRCEGFMSWVCPVPRDQ